MTPPPTNSADGPAPLAEQASCHAARVLRELDEHRATVGGWPHPVTDRADILRGLDRASQAMRHLLDRLEHPPGHPAPLPSEETPLP